mmetsp:Transcript_13196/g.36233  ORF Transcript_13196/g.36233 Transcript_13196/m.36233 type:complete len:398 (-) Transcript_13196:287-1480(-)
MAGTRDVAVARAALHVHALLEHLALQVALASHAHNFHWQLMGLEDGIREPGAAIQVVVGGDQDDLTHPARLEHWSNVLVVADGIHGLHLHDDVVLDPILLEPALHGDGLRAVRRDGRSCDEDVHVRVHLGRLQRLLQRAHQPRPGRAVVVGGASEGDDGHALEPGRHGEAELALPVLVDAVNQPLHLLVNARRAPRQGLHRLRKAVALERPAVERLQREGLRVPGLQLHDLVGGLEDHVVVVADRPDLHPEPPAARELRAAPDQHVHLLQGVGPARAGDVHRAAPPGLRHEARRVEAVDEFLEVHVAVAIGLQRREPRLGVLDGAVAVLVDGGVPAEAQQLLLHDLEVLRDTRVENVKALQRRGVNSVRLCQLVHDLVVVEGIAGGVLEGRQPGLPL